MLKVLGIVVFWGYAVDLGYCIPSERTVNRASVSCATVPGRVSLSNLDILVREGASRGLKLPLTLRASAQPYGQAKASVYCSFVRAMLRFLGSRVLGLSPAEHPEDSGSCS